VASEDIVFEVSETAGHVRILPSFRPARQRSITAGRRETCLAAPTRTEQRDEPPRGHEDGDLAELPGTADEPERSGGSVGDIRHRRKSGTTARGAGNELLTRGPAPRLDQAIRLPPIV
jgi:hypothetical protein